MDKPPNRLYSFFFGGPVRRDITVGVITVILGTVAGVLVLVLRGDGGTQPTATRLEIDPLTSHAGEGEFLSFRRDRFDDHEDLRVTIGGRAVADLDWAARNGDWTFGVQIPLDLKPGGHLVKVTGLTSGRTASAVLKLCPANTPCVPEGSP